MKSNTIIIVAMTVLLFGSSILVQAQKRGIIDGHKWVDLGLPSKTIWATCNVGASSPEKYGDSFAFAETQPKSSYTWDNLKYYVGAFGPAAGRVIKYSKYTKDDGRQTLDPEDDAASVNWGGSWRMPTSEELDELVQYCKWYWTTIRGVSGYQVYGPNGESIFLPAAGRYIEKSRVNDGLMGCYRSSSKACLSFHKSISAKPGSVGGGEERRFGASVRPVWGAR